MAAVVAALLLQLLSLQILQLQNGNMRCTAKNGSILSEEKGKISGLNGTLRKADGFSIRPAASIIDYTTLTDTYMVSSAGPLGPPSSKSADCHRPQPAINLAEFRGHELGRMPVMAAVRTSKTKMPRFGAKPIS